MRFRSSCSSVSGSAPRQKNGMPICANSDAMWATMSVLRRCTFWSKVRSSSCSLSGVCRL